jgi:hypothetical protein
MVRLLVLERVLVEPWESFGRCQCVDSAWSQSVLLSTTHQIRDKLTELR